MDACIVSEPVPVGAGNGSWYGVLLYHYAAQRKGRKEMRIRTGTLVDPQTEELATVYKGLNNRNRM